MRLKFSHKLNCWVRRDSDDVAEWELYLFRLGIWWKGKLNYETKKVDWSPVCALK